MLEAIELAHRGSAALGSGNSWYMESVEGQSFGGQGTGGRHPFRAVYPFRDVYELLTLVENSATALHARFLRDGP